MKTIAFSTSLFVCALALSGCATSTSYYTKNETTNISVEPSDAVTTTSASAVSGAIAIGTKLVSSWAKSEVAKEDARYTAAWSATGEHLKPLTSLSNLKVSVVRKAEKKGAPQKTATLSFAVEREPEIEGRAFYRLKLANVDYQMTKAKVSKLPALLGGSPKKNVDVQIALRLNVLASTPAPASKPAPSGKPDAKIVEQPKPAPDEKPNATITAYDLLKSTLVLRDVDPEADAVRAAKMPNWKSDWFSLPAGTIVWNVSAFAEVTETAKSPILVQNGDNLVDKLVEALKPDA